MELVPFFVPPLIDAWAFVYISVIKNEGARDAHRASETRLQ
jgi:hypothetical protein